MGQYMCAICGSDDAQEIEVEHEGIGVACARCGEYEISREAIDTMRSNRYSFNPGISLAWLLGQTGTGRIPLITWEVAAKLI